MAVEPIADAVTGGLVAQAVEPATGDTDGDGFTDERACLNCGTPLAGTYCHSCGQRGHVHRTLGAFFHDLVHGILHFEGKIWRTLPLLAWRPGALTRRYIDGERARFVSPIALFLFTVFLMFAVISSLGGPVNVNTGEISEGIKADVAASEQRVKILEAERARIVAAGGGTVQIDRRINDARDAAGLEQAIARDGARGAAARVSDDVPAWLAEPLKRAADNPQLFLYKVQNNAYKYSWMLIPLSVPFLWLLFPFSRRFRLYDHVVFVTYSLSFMTLLIVLAALSKVAGLTAITIGALIYAPFHLYRQLRETYGLGRVSAMARTLLLLIFAALALALFALLMIALGVF